MVQLVERLLPTPEDGAEVRIQSSAKLCTGHMLTASCRKDENKGRGWPN